MIITKEQARMFLLTKHGLTGKHKYAGKQGALEYIRQCGCIQFDPVDICSRNADLVLQSRVAGYKKNFLDELLCSDRALFDYFDKNLCIIPIEDWKYFDRIRQAYSHFRSKQHIDAVEAAITSQIHEQGSLCSHDFEQYQQKVDWYWSETRLSRAALESLYFRGILAVHHKRGTQKYYSLAADTFPSEILNAPSPIKSDMEYYKWRMLRRIGAIGLLWNRPSDAWLNIEELNAKTRTQVFAELEADGAIAPVTVEGIKYPLYCLSKDEHLLVCAPEKAPMRTEFLAPLDCMLWDRKLIEALFGFAYRWEIYTPAVKRLYGAYTLPVLQGNKFIGRIDMSVSKDVLKINNFWPEAAMRYNKRSLDARIKAFARYSSCTLIQS